MRLLNTVLLIDDDDTTNYLNQRLIKQLKIARNIQVATNGEEGIQYLKDHCLQPPDTASCPELIFLDIKMPVMDGFEFLDAYYHLQPRATVPSVIIMLTSSASRLDLNRLQRYPTVVKFLNKPLTATHVTEIMTEFFAA